ncbi:HTH domain-containing protein, partial [Flavimarina sp. Hel_I_48]
MKELADKLNVSTRTVERYLQGLYTKENNKIVIPLDVVNL